LAGAGRARRRLLRVRFGRGASLWAGGVGGGSTDFRRSPRSCKLSLMAELASRLSVDRSTSTSLRSSSKPCRGPASTSRHALYSADSCVWLWRALDVPRPAYPGTPIAGPLQGLQRSKGGRTSGPSGVAVVVRTGFEGQSARALAALPRAAKPAAPADVAEDDADRGALAVQPEATAPISRLAVPRHDRGGSPVRKQRTLGSVRGRRAIALPTAMGAFSKA
jgi:hypothetical protein